MSEDDDLKYYFEHLSCDDTHHLQYLKRKQQTPFHIVLIDLKLAAEERIIRCVEKPLVGDENLKYVALSYRWGELHETMVDTGLDYSAIVTSFNLADFYVLCHAIAKEADLRFMDYVWVDAICVDQRNYERRKATIHQMSNIYARANYILAVPDLHFEHLWCTHSSIRENMKYIEAHGELIFQLLHGNVDQLCRIDYEKLDHDDGPMTMYEQKYRLANSIDFLIDLITDWSTRVWVISECNIAKKKHSNMKYWFIQLGYTYSSQNLGPEPGSYFFENYLFFKFDFNNDTLLMPPFVSGIISKGSSSIFELGSHFECVYKDFHAKMMHQLGSQTFLEMILKSKASRNEDRFHAVLPNSKYEHIIKSKDDVDSWKINNFFSIKLKLFEFMDTEDKLMLLFLSGSSSSLYSAPDILPTFATSNIDWPDRLNLYFPTNLAEWNFDMNSKSTIMMIRVNGNYGIKCKLNVKPIRYFIGFGKSHETEVNRFMKYKKSQCKRLELDDPNEPLQIVYIPIRNFTSIGFIHEYYKNYVTDSAKYLVLVGSFHRNRWVLHGTYEEHLNSKDITSDDSFDNDRGFDIY